MNPLIGCDLTIKSHSGLAPYQREYYVDMFPYLVYLQYPPQVGA